MPAGKLPGGGLDRGCFSCDSLADGCFFLCAFASDCELGMALATLGGWARSAALAAGRDFGAAEDGVAAFCAAKSSFSEATSR